MSCSVWERHSMLFAGWCLQAKLHEWPCRPLPEVIIAARFLFVLSIRSDVCTDCNHLTEFVGLRLLFFVYLFIQSLFIPFHVMQTLRSLRLSLFSPVIGAANGWSCTVKPSVIRGDAISILALLHFCPNWQTVRGQVTTRLKSNHQHSQKMILWETALQFG